MGNEPSFWDNVTTAISNVWSVVTTTITQIMNNPLLAAIFCASLIFVAFRVIKKAKKASR